MGIGQCDRMLRSNLRDELASHPGGGGGGGVAILLVVASCCRNRDNLWQCELLWPMLAAAETF